MKEFLIKGFEYNASMNSKFFESLIAWPEMPEKAKGLMSHVVGAHHLWNCRILKKEPTLGVWENLPIDQWEDWNRRNHQTTLEILKTFDLGAAIEYKNTKGERFVSQLQDILFHVLNHGTHHRAQISSMLREVDATPVVSDYIFYSRSALS